MLRHARYAAKSVVGVVQLAGNVVVGRRRQRRRERGERVRFDDAAAGAAAHDDSVAAVDGRRRRVHQLRAKTRRAGRQNGRLRELVDKR